MPGLELPDSIGEVCGFLNEKKLNDGVEGCKTPVFPHLMHSKTLFDTCDGAGEVRFIMNHAHCSHNYIFSTVSSGPAVVGPVHLPALC